MLDRPESNAAARPAPPGEQAGVRVLVADDSPDILMLVVVLLRESGYEVLSATNGEEALEIAATEHPDLAVLDVMMPGLDGYDVTRQLRAGSATNQIPVLLLTALASGDDVARGFEAGADDYLRKPFNSEELRARVSSLLERRKLIGRLVEQARTDSLTGVLNRRAWDEELARELVRSERYGDSLCLALFDFDRFKEYNDTQGHQAGDTLLQEVAHGWKLHVRGVDLIARLGGDEFGVLLPNCEYPQALQVVERLRSSIPFEQTCSAGLAQWNGRESLGQLVQRTDQALYAAKAGGRNSLTQAAPAAA